jgi:hypothetical protein
MSFDLKDGLGAASRLAPRLVLISLALLFCAHWIVLAHYAVDIPFLDDWRPYTRAMRAPSHFRV